MVLDIHEMEPVNNVKFLKGNILEENTKIEIKNILAILDVILSDRLQTQLATNLLTQLEQINYAQTSYIFQKKCLNLKVYCF